VKKSVSRVSRRIWAAASKMEEKGDERVVGGGFVEVGGMMLSSF
jgi:hypothetical protein